MLLIALFCGYEAGTREILLNYYENPNRLVIYSRYIASAFAS
jgi:hypothetical protein